MNSALRFWIISEFAFFDTGFLDRNFCMYTPLEWTAGRIVDVRAFVNRIEKEKNRPAVG